MRHSYLLTFIVIYCLAVTCSAAAAEKTESAANAVNPAECKIALRILTSAEYVSKHQEEIPDGGKLDENGKIEFIANLFKESIKKADNPAQLCTNTVRENLSYTGAYHFPEVCVEFLPSLKKSFEDKISYKKDMPNFVQQKMNDAIVEMLILDETAPEKLVARCETGIAVMRVDLNDKHLKERYPLPVTCEVLFAEMEKTMILPSQLETIQRQRVIFALENKNTPEKLVEICQEISK